MEKAKSVAGSGSIKGMSIRDLENAKSSSLWVLNNSGGNKKMMGIINISVREGNGQLNTVRIPVTSIPVDLSIQATKDAILSNPQFRRVIMGKMLIAISDEQAESLLDNDQAREEQQRLYSMGYDGPAELPEASPEFKSALNADTGNISGLALNLAHSNTPETEDQLVATLRNNQKALSSEDLSYIVNTSGLPKVKAEAAKMLMK
jgi:hypothetical protein